MAKADFSLLVVNTVRFLVYVGDNAQPYTARIPHAGMSPLEVDIQNHFHEFLSASGLAVVGHEVLVTSGVRRWGERAPSPQDGSSHITHLS